MFAQATEYLEEHVFNSGISAMLMQKMVREKNAKIEDAEKEAKRLAIERHALAASVDDLTEQLQLLKSQTGDKTKSLAAMQVGE